jgi:hypothetical protein
VPHLTAHVFHALGRGSQGCLVLRQGFDSRDLCRVLLPPRVIDRTRGRLEPRRHQLACFDKHQIGLYIWKGERTSCGICAQHADPTDKNDTATPSQEQSVCMGKSDLSTSIGRSPGEKEL